MAKPLTRRRAPRLSSDERVANILAAARQMIRARGYDAISMLEIAEEAGVVEGTIYRYFDSRRGLLEKVAENWFSEQLSEFSDVPAIGGTHNRLRHFIWRALEITCREPILTRYLLTELRPTIGFRDSPFFELNRRFTGEIRKLCKDAIASGEFRDDVSPSLLRDMVFGCIEHQTWAFLRNEGKLDIDKTADGITTVIFRGMAAGGEPDDLGSQVRRLEALGTRVENALAGSR